MASTTVAVDVMATDAAAAAGDVMATDAAAAVGDVMATDAAAAAEGGTVITDAADMVIMEGAGGAALMKASPWTKKTDISKPSLTTGSNVGFVGFSNKKHDWR
ncbi:hypothetical protein RHGRI_017994 [Rhododendron griersonianum]|uniref:Uncharacterized protein n=1 Tax=Rhododendron griersonianum TaxID=479676 RepID=A0AAV6K001_9ERIC|nr:hypothetical protein RHGRI_017992 [Rhododendron griersonianum]KAG5545697.1 hypothetical protein RHGRI_017994 [Rhododendron griersonianum]